MALIVGLLIFVVGVPSALSFGILSDEDFREDSL